MPHSIELVPFDPHTPSTVELGIADEVLGADTKIYNQSRQPYLIIRRAKPLCPEDEVVIWTVAAHRLSTTEPPKPLQLTPKGKLFMFQRISDSGARTGNYASFLAWLVAVDCSGRRKPVTFTQVENGNSPFKFDQYVGTFGNMENLFNVFAERQN